MSPTPIRPSLVPLIDHSRACLDCRPGRVCLHHAALSSQHSLPLDLLKLLWKWRHCLCPHHGDTRQWCSLPGPVRGHHHFTVDLPVML